MSLRPDLQRCKLDSLSLQSATATLEEELLTKNTFSANPQEDSMECRASLLRAAMRGDVVGCVNLIQKGFGFLNEKDARGCTALHYAVKHSLVPVVFALLSAPRFNEHNAGQAPGSRSSGRRQPLSSDIIDPLGPRLERFRDDFHSLGVEVVMDWKCITTSDLERMGMTVIQQRVFQARRASIAEKKEAANTAPQETERNDLVPD